MVSFTICLLRSVGLFVMLRIINIALVRKRDLCLASVSH